MRFESPTDATPPPLPNQSNPLWKHFSEHQEGRGIWKFNHYFEIYERYFERFRDREVHVLEIGIYSGGSLEMWQKYFGARCTVYGVDIEPRCKAYETESVRIFTGDQGDRRFWQHFKREVPTLDIVIDDGSHIPEHQIISIEELLPHLRTGGVYLCEDIYVPFNPFAAHLFGLAQNLNSAEFAFNLNDNERRSVCKTNPVQSAIAGIHFYPHLAVVERTAALVPEFVAPKHGSLWEPFLT